jgi:spore coat protein U-like protein
MKKNIRASAFAVALGLVPAFVPVFSGVQAATYSNGTAATQFTVTLTLQANCTIVANPLNFGTHGVLSAVVDRQTNVSVTCTNTTPYNVGLDAGNVTGSAVGTRLLAGTTTGNTATTVQFQLYQDAGHAAVWGNTQGTNTVAGVGTGAAQSLPIYGEVPVQATPDPDTYQTTVTATVYF